MKFSRSITLMLAGLAAIAALSGCGSNSNLTGLNQQLDTTPPPAPTNLTLSTNGSGQEVLVWDASAAPDVAGYQVQVYDASHGGFVQAGDPNSSDTSFLLPIVAIEITESYRVRAVDASGNWSAPSASADVTLPGSPIWTVPATPGVPKDPIGTN